jgi:Predicted glycosyltransferases
VCPTSAAEALTVVIPTWNGLRYLPDCLAALRSELSPHDRIIVVDNGSRDGTSAWLAEHAPDVELIRLAVNRGFAGGTNAGIRAAKTPLILLCNDDAFVEAGSIAALRRTLLADPALGIVGGVLTFAHRPDLVASAGINVSSDGLALDLWALRPVSELPSQPVPIFGASAGFALLRRTMLDQIGLFEESFFSYLEDVDLAWRIRLAGWEAQLVPEARARHIYSATSSQGSPFKQYLLARNRIRTLVRCLPSAFLADLPLILVYDLMALVYGLAKGQTAIAAGRLACLSELPALYRQRKAIQATRRASLAALRAWVTPASWPWELRRQAAELDAVLAAR